MDLRILRKATRRDKNQRNHYPVCPNCEKDYKELSACNQCNVIICDNCKEQHWQ